MGKKTTKKLALKDRDVPAQKAKGVKGGGELGLLSSAAKPVAAHLDNFIKIE